MTTPALNVPSVARIDESKMTILRDWRGENPACWHVTEKLRGCRAYWDGRCFWTRGGKVIDAPAWFTRGLPSGVHLDGEIYEGRCERETEASVAVEFGKFTRRCRFVEFDCPSAIGDYPARLAVAQYHWRDCVTQHQCQGHDALMGELLDVLARGGEGLVIRKPGVTSYEVGKTRHALKVKIILPIELQGCFPKRRNRARQPVP